MVYLETETPVQRVEIITVFMDRRVNGSEKKLFSRYSVAISGHLCTVHLKGLVQTDPITPKRHAKNIRHDGNIFTQINTCSTHLWNVFIKPVLNRPERIVQAC